MNGGLWLDQNRRVDDINEFYPVDFPSSQLHLYVADFVSRSAAHALSTGELPRTPSMRSSQNSRSTLLGPFFFFFVLLGVHNMNPGGCFSNSWG